MDLYIVTKMPFRSDVSKRYRHFVHYNSLPVAGVYI